MLVVLNHVGLGFPGGFIGVDVFFVISGFLITALILAERAQGRFSFRAFYLRRARRLLPALYLMILVVLAVGYWLLIPSDFSLLAQSALSAVALVSNHFFAAQTGGYFSPDAASLPLLHIWSLSLEEQVYLIWPAVLILLARMRSPVLMTALVASAAALSFAVGQYGAAHESIAAYFLLPARAGEFLIGALLALHWREGPAPPRPVLANLASAGGLTLILAAALLLDEASPFPGLNALWPCLGALLIIAAPRFGPSLVARVLSARPVVFLGLISYSVYLWHWPLVSFLRYARQEVTPLMALGVVAASLVLGAGSWWLVERTYRAKLSAARPAAWILGGLATLLVIAAPITIWAQAGLPKRFAYALLTQDELAAERDRYWRTFPAKGAVLTPGDGPTQLLIIGNSHAYDLAYAMIENGFGGGLRVVGTTQDCFNFGHDPVRVDSAPQCARRRQVVLNHPALIAADVIFLHDNWGGHDPAGLASMIGELRARSTAPIYVFGPKMTFQDDVLAIAKRAQDERHAAIGGINAFAAGFRDADKIERDRTLKAHFQTHRLSGVHYISTLDAQCGARLLCDILSPDGKFLYFDAGHLTLIGARRLGAELKRRHPELFAPRVFSTAKRGSGASH